MSHRQRARSLEWALLCAAAFASSCYASAPPDSSDASRQDTSMEDASTAAPGCDVPLDQCEQLGLYFGSCPGTAGPVLACDDWGRCFWYAGGCPIGFQRSSCPSDDVCCHETADGRWPFEAWEPSSGRAKVELMNDVAAMGWAAVDAENPRQVVVTLDPSVTAPADAGPIARCSPENPLWDVCGAPVDAGASVPQRIGRSLVVRFARIAAGHGQSLSLEIVEGVDGAIARLFVRYQDDADSPYTACLPFQPRFVSGTLRLSSIDELAHGRLRAELTSGHWIELDF